MIVFEKQYKHTFMGIDIIPQHEIILRLGLTLILAFVLGLERELKNQPAGLRTHILIGLGSCLLMILSVLVPEIYNSNINDPGRIAAQVVSGIWFLGAGAIIKMWLDTRGLTTAANIWATSAIWLCVWAGLYFAAITTTLLILLNLVLITKIKSRLITRTRFCTISLWFPKKWTSASSVYETIKTLPLIPMNKSIKEDGKNIHLTIVSKIKKSENIFEIQEQIKDITKIQKISISESVK